MGNDIDKARFDLFLADEINDLAEDISNAIENEWFEKAARLHIKREQTIFIRSRLAMGDFNK